MTRLEPWISFLTLVLVACGGPSAAVPNDDTLPTVTQSDTSVDRANPSAFVSLTFSEPMDRDSVENAFFRQPAFGCAWSWGPTSATCQITTGLAQLTTYTVILGTEAADEAGNRLATPYGFSFDSGDFHPRLVGVSPRNGAIHVSPDAPITFTFSEPVRVLSVADGLAVETGGIEVDGFLQTSSPDPYVSVIAFVPDAEYGPGQLVTWTLTTWVRDEAGTQLAADVSGSFRTELVVGTAVR